MPPGGDGPPPGKGGYQRAGLRISGGSGGPVTPDVLGYQRWRREFVATVEAAQEFAHSRFELGAGDGALGEGQRYGGDALPISDWLNLGRKCPPAGSPKFVEA